MKEIIKEVMIDVAEAQSKEIKLPIEDDDVLFELGLDSLCYAIVVVELEERLGFDPFQIEEEIIYPRTFSEFVGIYEKHG